MQLAQRGWITKKQFDSSEIFNEKIIKNIMADENQNINPGDEIEAADPKVLTEKLAAAEKQRDEYLSGWQRAKADFINYRKEEMKHLEEVARYGNEDLIKDLISVLDNFDLGLRALEKAGPVEKGVYLIKTQIEDILKKRGLIKVEVKPGDVFDPSIAEALSEVPADRPPGSVVEMIEPGYKLNEKMLRPARVIVAKEKG
jgi:molecular chaperone GrpE